MSKQVKTVGMLLALSALPMGAAYAGNVTSPTAVQNVQAEEECKGVVLDATGEPMIGASVVVKGKSGLGTVTDIDGNFTLRNVKKGETLRITSIGMTPVEVVYKGGVVNVTLKDDSHALNEVVVTALGMKRETKALGYAVTELKGDDLSRANTISPVSSLQGKVAGVDIAASDGGIFGATKIQIRGASTLKGNNQPIYVIDGVILDNNVSGSDDLNWTANPSDYGNELKNLNPDDFETVSVLKGAAATALYGSRALNGAVVITTKSGKGKKKGVGVSFSQTVGFDVIVGHPEAQYEYGYGLWPGNRNMVGNGNRWQDDGTPNHPNSFGVSTLGVNADGVASLRNASYTGYGWGPKFDGSDIENYDGTMTKYSAYKNPADEFYRTGINTNTNVAISGGNDVASFYSSFSYKHADGQTINNTFDRYSMLLKGTYQITKKLDIAASMSMAYSKPRNAQQEIGLYTVYSGLPRWSNPSDWKNHYKGDHGGIAQTAYGDKYGYVPDNVKGLWWNLNENDYVHKEWMFRPTWELNYHILDWLTAKVDGNINYYTRSEESKALGNGYAMEGGGYGLASYSKTQLTLGATLSASKQLGDFNLGGFARMEYYNKTEQSNSVSTNGGLIVPGQYFIGNSKNTANYGASISGTKRMVSAIFAINASWKDQLYLDVTGRNDVSSALVYSNGTGNYSYFYPSVSGSWLITETLKGQLPKWISFAKVRASWAQVGNDLDPYSLNQGFSVGNITTANGKIYTNNFSSSSVYAQDLKPERKNSWEVGLDFRVLKNRIGLDFTYYKENTKNQIMSIATPGVSGIDSRVINAGNIQNSGIEVALNTTPVQTGDWQWDLNFTYTRNRSKIVSLYPGVDYLALQGQVNAYDYRIGSVAKVGGEYGLLMSDISPARDEKGNILLDWDDQDRIGYQKRSGKVEVVGSSQPDFLGSVSSTLRWKDLSLNIALDCRFGGKVASYANRYGTANGNTKSSLKYRDEAHGGLTWTSKWLNTDGTQSESYGITYHDGVIPEGVFAQGTTIACADGVERDMSGVSYAEAVKNGWLEPVHAGAYWYYMNDWGGGVLNKSWFQTLNYIALREISVAYKLPNSWASKICAQAINVSFSARNLGYLYNSLDNNLNPESVRGNRAGEFRIRSFNPYTANFMFTINASF